MSTAETFTSAGLWSAITRTPALSTSHIGVICAWSAVIIYASSNSIVSLLVSIGEASPVAGAYSTTCGHLFHAHVASHSMTCGHTREVICEAVSS